MSATKATRTKIEATVSGVRLTTLDDEGRSITRDFYTQRCDETGYVFEGNGRQVCEGLYSTGATLESRGDLLALVRREWRRRQRAERRAARA